jgi:hypothetical protein
MTGKLPILENGPEGNAGKPQTNAFKLQALDAARPEIIPRLTASLTA